MAPARPTHGAIQASLARLLENHFIAQGSPCRAVTEAGVVPRLSSRTNERIPDVSVTCTPDAPDQRSLPDPVVVIEILSPSNEAETRESVRAYTTIPTVMVIVVMSSIAIRAEIYRRSVDGTWPPVPQDLGAEDMLSLDPVGFACPVAEFYARTHLAAR